MLWFQNKLFFRATTPAELVNPLLGTVLFGISIYVLIAHQLVLLYGLYAIASMYMIQYSNRRGKNTIDLHHFRVAPKSTFQRFIHFWLIDVAEPKSLLLITSVVIAAFLSDGQSAFVILLFFLCFSSIITLYNLLIRRYASAYQTGVRFSSMLFSGVAMTALWLFLLPDVGNIILQYGRKADTIMLQHHILLTASVASLVAVLLILLCFICFRFVEAEKPFPNEKLIAKARNWLI